ncbi:magnesium-translocating P-type ATPase [Chryseobacterium sp. MDT2-18]|uniref:magnesium-translocating P-type ATPase n=1 Tax=Chryseobacterium sp. MDT2-18 TaxID=1259136 RepID=UPI00278453B7|nr:magnesium-translocating P-type ATPase [Chryseobacterium sp. MDT2-18]MDQ0477448.1 Mg2+-importing ATPase [Chryseobacterium sp. MDT2-18]
MLNILHKKVTASLVAPDNSANQLAAKQLLEAAEADPQKLFIQLESSEEGLSEDQVLKKRLAYGINEIAHEKAPSWYIQLLGAFINPFNGVLFLIGVVSFFMNVIYAAPGTKDYKEVIVVLLMILTSVLLRFSQEFRSNKAAEELKSMVKTNASVLRKDSGKIDIDIKKLVPGDLISVSAGDMIPADVRILHSKDLFVGQSMLTGEAMPVEKHDTLLTDSSEKSSLDLENICFLGTNVVSGTAQAIVVATGNQTYFGTMSESLVGKRAETSFEKGVNSVSWLLIRFMFVMVPLVFLINGLTKGNWLEAFMFGISVAVGLTPEMLPMIVTTNLAKGAVSMSKRKVVVKRLNAIQNIGAMDILCTDKTGTLTLDKIVMQRHLNIHGIEDDEVFKWAYLNSFYQTGLKNLMDLAVIDYHETHEEVQADLKLAEFKKVDEIPFDFNRRRMSVILEEKNRKHFLICKGAVEEMLSVCNRAIDPGADEQSQFFTDAIIPLDENLKNKIIKIIDKLNEDGLRVLLIGVKESDAGPLTYSIADECDLVLTGFIGFLDPAKPTASAAVHELQKLGVNIKVLTGDNGIVTKKICREVGIPVTNVLLGNELEKMTDEEFQNKISTVSILAKLSPLQKSRVVKLLQQKGHTVGFMGDGINDAAALRDADVGVSVDTGVDIAKESADIILLEKDLMVLQKGVVYGRRTHGNIIKYIKMTASSNFGNMFSVLGASALLPFLPMLPIQILINNLLYDFSQISIPWDRMDSDYIQTPHKWDASGISKFMIIIGPISSVFDYATFALMWFIFKANSPEHQSLFQTGWFVESLISQTLIVHMIRTRKIPFIQSWASAPVVALTSTIMLVGILIPFSPFAAAFKMTPLPLIYFPWLLGILFSYCLLTQFVKNWFIKKYNSWL